MTSPDELLRAVEEASSAGAEYAEARYHRVEGLTMLFLNGVLVGATQPLSEGVAVRVLYRGSMGFAATSDLSREGLREVVQRALAAARSSLSQLKKPISVGQAFLGSARYSVVERRPLADVSLEDKVKDLGERLKGVELRREGMKVNNHALTYSERAEHKIVVTNDGAMVESKIPRVSLFYNITASAEGKRANRWNQLGAVGGFEAVDALNFQEEFSGDLDSLYVNLVKASSPPRGVMDVVLGPEIVGLAMHEAVGHPSEADRVMGREAAQAGLSYRRELRVDKIGSELVSVYDDPTIPGSYGFYLYDDEGVAARKRALIYKGVLAEMLHNRETAAAYGTESNASARAIDYRSEPIVRMANTYMAPGDHSFEEIVESVREGVYIKKYMEWNIDDYRWGARYVGLEAYLIRGGRLAEPVRDVVLEINTRDFFSSVAAVGKDLTFSAGTCGKGEPPQPLPVTMGGPHVLLRGVRVK
ncbi:MAG: TldD/PmbA family protein [Acidilobaceae archaeon]|nr:TldD/PmbA family protein [Acidilobaceae archaeon]